VRPAVIHGALGLSGPRDLAVDGDRVFVADTGNNRILRLDAKGKVTRAIAGGLKGATGLAAGPGWLAVADTWNHRVIIYDQEGRQLRVLGPDDGKGKSLFGPRDVAKVLDRWYVVDTGNRRVVVYGDNGLPAGSWGKEGAGADGMIEPVGLAVGPAGGLYIADTGNRRIRLTDTAGRQSAAWPVPGWTEFYTEPYVAPLPDGGVALSDSSTGTILLFSPDGTLVKRLTLDASAGRWQPEGIAFAADGSFWVADRLGNRIVVLPGEALR
jgi:DNA-binding beta-propeller fold protein YncE